MTSADVQVNDVIQLDPEHCGFGPMLCIVSEVKSWGVQCYWLVAEERGKPPSCAYARVRHGHYVVVGSAEWAAAKAEVTRDLA